MSDRFASLVVLDTPTLSRDRDQRRGRLHVVMRRRVVPCESGEFVFTERLASVRGAPVWRVVAIRELRREAA